MVGSRRCLWLAIAVALAVGWGRDVAAGGERDAMATKGEAMKSCDFARSFITFVLKGRANNARIQVEARCELIDTKTGEAEHYYLVASCKGEDTYGAGRLFLVPSYDFCMVYSSSDFLIIRTHANAERDNTSTGAIKERFEDVKFHITLVDADVLPDSKAVVAATLANRAINGRTEVADPSGRYRAVIEFPVKTMNVNDIRRAYQVDTGPILLPDFTSAKARMVERFVLAFVAYNGPDEAWFVIQEPTAVAEGRPEKVSAYSRVVAMKARNSVLALR